jgi:hypothetical protein
MGLIRATYKAGKAAVKGASGAEIAKEGVKGLLPRSMGGIVDKVATPNNISRVSGEVRNVVDNGRVSTFHDSTGSVPPPPPGGSNNNIKRASTPSNSAPPPPPLGNW